jgi:hypothetical protein
MSAPTFRYALPARSPATLRAFAFALLSPLPAVEIPSDILNASAAHRLSVRSALIDIANDLERGPGLLNLEIGAESGLSATVVRDLLMLGAA